MTARLFAIAVVACLALAAGSLAFAHEPAYDAWAWLVWGRELARLQLDTSSGPSWKPLPVAIAALLSVAGDAAPALWLVIVRGAWLLSLVLAGALAYRLTHGLGRPLRVAAGAFAAVTLLLLFDEVTAWTRQAAVGMSEPLLVALVLGAVAAGLDGRSRLALGLGGLAALVRPEAWPLLAAYGLWRWRAEPGLRPWIAGVALAVAASWVVPELLAGGGASSAGERALRGDESAVEAVWEVLGRAVTMPLAVAWPLAALAVAVARWPAAASFAAARAPFAPRAAGPAAAAADPSAAVGARASSAPRAAGSAATAAGPSAAVAARGPCAPRAAGSATVALLSSAPAILALGALAWIATVAAMAAAGFPGLPRFMASALAVVAVLAGTGLARLLALGRAPIATAALALAVLAATLPQLPARVADLHDAAAASERVAQRGERLRELTDEIGRDPLLRCGRLATSYVLVRTALAWQLDVPLTEVVSFGLPSASSGAFVVGPGAPRPVREYLRTHADLLGRRREWRIYSLDCSPTAAASSSRSAGVSGARR